MTENTKISPQILKRVPELRAKGMTFSQIAQKLGIGETTARKHRNYDYTPPMSQVAAQRQNSYRFTQRQMEIATTALENRERGRLTIV